MTQHSHCYKYTVMSNCLQLAGISIFKKIHKCTYWNVMNRFFSKSFIFLICSFFIYKFIYFNWRLITLQYCSGFAKHWHDFATAVHVFPILNPLPTPSPSHSSGSFQCNSPKHPVSCIEPGLPIHFTYDNIHVSIPFSQIISPSPTESKRLFYTSVSLLLSCIQGYCYHLSKFHIYALVYCIGCFSFWLTSPCIIGSSFIHLIRTDSNVFFFMAE